MSGPPNTVEQGEKGFFCNGSVVSEIIFTIASPGTADTSRISDGAVLGGSGAAGPPTGHTQGFGEGRCWPGLCQESGCWAG